ncbi:MAG: iron-sulfur cluster assembly accessory protein [Chlamydiia bacterium]|nr:iron-sulfur cluster assembly accessory protein [Chlamydiia bacterium]
MATKVKKDMTIESILGMFPNKAQKLSQEITNAGLHCVGCGAATWETLEQGMQGHGKTPEQVDHLVDRLNKLLDEPVDITTITLTAKAAQKFVALAEEDGKAGWGLRFDEQMAGCSGFEYILDFSEKAEADDEVFVSQGIEIHVNKKKLSRLIGAEIDYLEGLHSTGFKISNPNARASCGCGSSHGY